MWVFAYTVNHGNNDLTDHWAVHQTEEEARADLEEISRTEARLFCWAICKITEGSEPHYSDDWKLS